jgi:hypothetical protein
MANKAFLLAVKNNINSKNLIKNDAKISFRRVMEVEINEKSEKKKICRALSRENSIITLTMLIKSA